MARTLQVTCTILLVGILVMNGLMFFKQQDTVRELHSSRRIFEGAFVRFGPIIHSPSGPVTRLRSKEEAIKWLRQQGVYWNSISAEREGSIFFYEDDRIVAALHRRGSDATFPLELSICVDWEVPLWRN